MVWRRHALAAHFCYSPNTTSSRAPVEQFPVTPHTHTEREGRICAGGRVSALAEVDNGYGISPNANHSTVVCAAVWRVVLTELLGCQKNGLACACHEQIQNRLTALACSDCVLLL